MTRSLPRLWLYACALTLLIGSASQATAQRIQVEAVVGSPFGVGRITVPGRKDAPGDPWADGRIDIVEQDGRVLYPVYSDGPVRQFLRKVVPVPNAVTIFFLFQGDDPLTLTVTSPAEVSVPVQPRRFQANQHRRLLTQWWREYSRAAVRHSRSSDYPVVVDVFLTSTLGRRLSLPIPQLPAGGLFRPAANDGLELLLGTERMKTSIQQQSLSGIQSSDGIRQVPGPHQWLPPTYSATAKNVAVEPMAMHVPADCLYLRCGNYANYTWMQLLTEEWGGQIRNMLSYRGVDYGINRRIEQSLGLKDSALSRALGGTIISDVAIIGADPFFREGAAIGMLFEASNSFLLGQSIAKQRADTVAEHGQDGMMDAVEIEGVTVSYASSRDGRLRSYYVADDRYHLVTTCRSVVADFLKVARGNGKGSLGQSPGFRHARSLVPVDRDDTLFLYLSDEFFTRLASPQYQIEMRRRLRSLTEMDSIKLARYAAIAEGQKAESVDELIEADLLPAGFGRRADGSEIRREGDRLVDSIRGLPGSFVPVPDVPVDRVSESEARHYQSFVQAYAASPSRMDPVILAVRRAATGDENLERVTVDALVAPLRARQYQRLTNVLGEPRNQRMGRVEGDLVRVDGIGPNNNYLFLGIQDFEPPLAAQNGRLNWILPAVGTVRGYLGGSPGLGVLERLMSLVLGGPSGPPDIDGYTLWPMGIWQRTSPTRNMNVLSFQRPMLDWVTPRLKFQQLPNPGQIHLDVADLTHTQLSSALNALGYQHARNVSIGNTAFMQSLARQLHVPDEDCLDVAQNLIHAKLVCSLGGNYVLQPAASGRETWMSTAWSGENRSALATMPPDYVFPVLQWFRGMNAQATVRDDILSLQANLLIKRHAKMPAFDLSDLLKSEPPPPPADAPRGESPEFIPPVATIPNVEIPKAEIPQADLPTTNDPAPEELPPPKPILPQPTIDRE